MRTQENAVFIILAYVGIIPSYLMVLNKMNALCKIGAYLNLYHEGNSSKFNWEKRHMEYRRKYESSKFRIIS